MHQRSGRRAPSISLSPAFPALGVFVVSKGAFLVALAAAVGGTAAVARLLAFDGGWYLGIVEDGYQYPGTGEGGRSNLAFFPALPMIATTLTWLGVPSAAALLAVAWAGSAAAVVVIALLGQRLGSASMGVWLVLLWCIAPRSHVQVMAYTEGIFTAFAAAFLLALLNRRWWWAGTFAALAGLTRATAVAVVGTLVIAAVVEVIRRLRGRQAAPLGTVVGATALGASGVLAYLGYVAVRTGAPLGYLDVQATWNSAVGTPLWTLAKTAEVLVSLPQQDPLHVQVALCLVAYLGLFLWMIVRREPWPLLVFVTLGMALAFLQAGFFNSKMRLLLPLFPLLLPLARVAAAAPSWVSWPLAVVALVLSAWWGVDTAQMLVSP
ncbi:hypothetical protein F7P69_27390 [Cellulosimicrobium funkei]|nr:hypothetical protein [Cellulosimicrobium funkei]